MDRGRRPARARWSRRTRVLIGTLAVVVAPPTQVGAQEGAPPPPPARTVEAVDTTAAGLVPDPFRWLEGVDDGDVREWYVAQRRRTASVLRGPGGHDELGSRLRGLLNGDIALPPREAGGLLFYERAVAGANGSPAAYVVETRAGPEAAPQRLLDPRDVTADGSVTRFTDVVPSPDGRRLLVGVPDGAEGATLRLYDRLRATFVADIAEGAVPGTASWWPGSDAVLFTRTIDGDVEAEQEVVRVVAGGRPQVLFTADRPGPVRGWVSGRGEWLIVTHQDPPTPPSPWPGYQGPSGEKPTWVGTASVRGEGPVDVRPLLPARDGRYRFLGTSGGEALFRTAPDDGFGRIVAVGLEEGRFGDVRTLFAADAPGPDAPVHRAERMVDAALVAGGVAVGLDRGLDGRILIVGFDGRIRREVRPPEPGPVSGFQTSEDGHRLLFRWGSFLRRQPVAWIDVEGDGRGVFAPVGPALDPAAYEVRRAEYRSADGTSVPIFVVHGRDADRNGETPLVLYAYGGWGWSVSPWYHQRFATWLADGGAVAIANVRGGGEHGRPWHEDGKLGRRRNAVDDLHAAARWLVDRGYTSRDRLAVLGLSAGAPTVGSALLSAPELFGAAVLEVGLHDLVRFGVAREFGDPSDPAGAEAALAFSPYHQVPEDVCLPPTLIVTSEDDNLFPQALKLTARLQSAQECEAPVLLHVGEAEGHLPTGWVGVERHLNELIFLRRYLRERGRDET